MTTQQTAVHLNTVPADADERRTAVTTNGFRRGTFVIASIYMEPDRCMEIAGLFDGMVVFHTESNPFEGFTRFFAAHPSFDPVPAGERTPEYVVICNRTGDTPEFYMERVVQENML